MLSAYLERRQDRKRAANEDVAKRFSEAAATAGFFGPLEAHIRGGHDQLIDPDCELCRSHGVPAEGPRIAVAA